MNSGEHKNLLSGETSLRRVLGCAGALLLFPLWMSGALGDALSLDVTLVFGAALIGLTIAVPTARLDNLLQIILIISSTSLGLFAADYGLRIFGGSKLYYRAHTEFLRRDTTYPSLTRYLPNVQSSRITFGDLAAISGVPAHKVARREEFRTDAFGFRNDTSSPESSYEVVVVGDSYGMGLGVSQDEHWAALLNHGGREVYNLSIPSTCPAHGAARLSLQINQLRLAPQATIIAPVYTGNDIEDCVKSVGSILAEGPQDRIQKLITAVLDYRSRSPLRQLGMRLVYRFLFSDPVIESVYLPSHKADILFYKPHDRALRASRSEIKISERFQNLREGLLRMSALAYAHNARLWIPIFPSKEEVYGWLRESESPWRGTDGRSGLAEALQEVCKEHGLSCLDLKPLLINEAKKRWEQGEILWWLDDSHWNRIGHEVTKRIVDEALTKPVDFRGNTE